VSPVYELGCYIPEDDILHSHRRENLKSYMFHFTDISLLQCPLEMSRFEHGSQENLNRREFNTSISGTDRHLQENITEV
jgi:hypothetical protein